MKHNPYPEYQSLDIEWNKTIPTHWKPSRLKYDSYIKARVGWHGLTSDDFTDIGPYLITGSDFSGKEIDWKNCHHCELDRYEQDPYIQLKDDDLLITKDGTIGKVILAGKLPDKATLNSGLFVLRPLNDCYLTKYYYWLMQSPVFHGFVEYYRTGSTILHLYQETFCNLQYGLPPLPEQKTIAAFLDYETGKIDLLIKKQQDLIALLEEKRQAVISHAVTKDLKPNVRMKQSGVEWLGDVPEHWGRAKFNLCVSIANGQVDPRKSPYSKVLLIAPNHIESGTARIIGQESAKEQGADSGKYWCDEGDVIYSKIRPALKKMGIAPEDCLCSADMYPMKGTNGLRNKYIYWYLLSDNFSTFAILESDHVAMPKINRESLGGCFIPLPPEEEQQEIDSYIENMSQKTDILISKAKSAIELMQERRTALISAAVTGKIDVRDWEKDRGETMKDKREEVEV